MPPGFDDAAVADFLRSAQRDHLLYETAGVFWLWAEVVILFAMREARATLAGGHPSHWLGRFSLWMAACALLLTPLLLRHFLPGPLALVESGAESHAIAGAYTTQVLTHLAVWSIFVVAWVLLESAIVLEGMRAYRHFNGRCKGLLRAGAVTAALFAWTSLAHADAPVAEALREAEAALQPYRNAVYLHLRIAGVVWIAVEWVAAVLLWRGQSLLWRVVRHESSAP